MPVEELFFDNFFQKGPAPECPWVIVGSCSKIKLLQNITCSHLVFLRFSLIHCSCIKKNSCHLIIEGSIHLKEGTCQRRVNEFGPRPSGIKIKLG